MSFDFKQLSLHEVILIEPRVVADKRGFFMETYKYSDFVKMGIKEKFVQDNHSMSMKSVLRGLHYQENPKAQGKLVRCLKGRILDVAVDIRKESANYAQWVGVELSEENHQMLYIPVGFAHGFLVLSETAEIAYKCTEEYSHEHDRGIIWNDPEININWPIKDPIISEKDANLPGLRLF
ncbi:dTDP-4-dehydrorhamnose 3,5-epimerase [bacterium]|nr:dTDP-4-dehydrorhamnose 3,5-epimerase [bacterium]